MDKFAWPEVAYLMLRLARTIMDWILLASLNWMLCLPGTMIYTQFAI